MTHCDWRGPSSSVMACRCRSLFLFSSCGSLRSDPFHTQRIFVLGTAISNVRLLPKPPHTSHLYPHNPLTRHPHIIQYTPGTRRYSLASTLLSYCITVSSLDHIPSRFVFHSLFPVRSVRFALILLFLALGCVPLSSPLLLLSTIFICALPFFPALFYDLLVTAPRDSHHLEYRQSHYSETGNTDPRDSLDGRQESGRSDMNLIVLPF